MEEMIIEKMYSLRNDEQSIAMSKYLRNLFPFIGISKPNRVVAYGDYIKEKLKSKSLDFSFVDRMFLMPEREFHYLGIDYLRKGSKYLQKGDLEKLKELIVVNSWWDSVDSIAPIIGEYLKLYSDEMYKMIEWSSDRNFWVRRVSIIFQLSYKEKTDFELLGTVIESNLGTSEFFINKAIGWALRQYSKSDKVWVKDYIEKNKTKLTPLSIREGSKYL